MLITMLGLMLCPWRSSASMPELLKTFVNASESRKQPARGFGMNWPPCSRMMKQHEDSGRASAI